MFESRIILNNEERKISSFLWKVSVLEESLKSILTEATNGEVVASFGAIIPKIEENYSTLGLSRRNCKVLWNENFSNLNFALLLEKEVEKKTCVNSCTVFNSVYLVKEFRNILVHKKAREEMYEDFMRVISPYYFEALSKEVEDLISSNEDSESHLLELMGVEFVEADTVYEVEAEVEDIEKTILGYLSSWTKDSLFEYYICNPTELTDKEIIKSFDINSADLKAERIESSRKEIELTNISEIFGFATLMDMFMSILEDLFTLFKIK